MGSNEKYEFYKKQLEKYETKEQKIEYLEDVIFDLEMIDRWKESERLSYIVLCQLLNEVKNEESANNI